MSDTQLERKNTSWVTTVTALPVTLLSVVTILSGYDTAELLAVFGLVAPVYSPFLAVVAVRSRQWLTKHGVEVNDTSWRR